MNSYCSCDKRDLSRWPPGGRHLGAYLGAFIFGVFHLVGFWRGGWGGVGMRHRCTSVHAISRPGRLCFGGLSSCHVGFGKALTGRPDAEQARDRPHGSREAGPPPHVQGGRCGRQWGPAPSLPLVGRWGLSPLGAPGPPLGTSALTTKCFVKKLPYPPSTESPWEVATDPLNTWKKVFAAAWAGRAAQAEDPRGRGRQPRSRARGQCCVLCQPRTPRNPCAVPLTGPQDSAMSPWLSAPCPVPEGGRGVSAPAAPAWTLVSTVLCRANVS